MLKKALMFTFCIGAATFTLLLINLVAGAPTASNSSSSQPTPSSPSPVSTSPTSNGY